MNEATQRALEQAYELIEADKLPEAEALLKPILEREQDNADAWWLYAHAVRDPETARMALNQVLNLDNGYAGAQELLSQLDETLGEPQTEVLPSAPPTLPDEEDVEAAEYFADEDDEAELIGPEDDFVYDEDVFAEEVAEPEQSRGFRPLLIIIPLLLILLAVVLILVILNPSGGSDTTAQATSTVVVQQAAPTSTEMAPDAATEIIPDAATESATETSPDSATETVPDAGLALLPLIPPDEALASEIEAALADYEIVSDTVGTMATELGNTLVVAVCSSSTSAMGDTLDATMVELASVSESTGSETDALGIALVDCAGEPGLLHVIAAPVDAAVAFDAGDMDLRDYQAEWQPVA